MYGAWKQSFEQFLNKALDVLMYHVLDVNHRLASPHVWIWAAVRAHVVTMRAKAVALMHTACESCTLGRLDPVLRKRFLSFSRSIHYDFWDFYKMQPSDCEIHRASWYACYLEGSRNMNLTCKISKKFHIPKQTSSTGGSLRQSHSRCSVHLYHILYLYKYVILSSSLHFSLSKLFVAGSHLALPSWWPLGNICHPNASPAVCVLEGIGAIEYSRWWSNYTTQQKGGI